MYLDYLKTNFLKKLELSIDDDFLETLELLLEMKYWEKSSSNITEEKKIEILEKNKNIVEMEILNLHDKFLLKQGLPIDIRKNQNIKFSVLLLNSGMFKTYQKQLINNDVIKEDILYADNHTIVIKKGVELTYFDKDVLYTILSYGDIEKDVISLDLYKLRKHLNITAYSSKDRDRIIKSLENLAMTFLKIKTKYYDTNNEEIDISNFFNLFTFSNKSFNDNNLIKINLTKQFYELLALKNENNKFTFRYINYEVFNSFKEPLSKIIYERMQVLGRKHYKDRYFIHDSIQSLSEKFGYIIPIQKKQNKEYIFISRIKKQLENSQKELYKVGIELEFEKDKEKIFKLKYKAKQRNI